MNFQKHLSALALLAFPPDFAPSSQHEGGGSLRSAQMYNGRCVWDPNKQDEFYQKQLLTFNIEH